VGSILKEAITNYGDLTIETSNLEKGISGNYNSKREIKLEILSGTLTGRIEHYGDITLGTEDSTEEDRPTINGSIIMCENVNMVNDHISFIVNNASIIAESGRAVGVDEGALSITSELLIKDGFIKSLNSDGEYERCYRSSTQRGEYCC